MGNQYEVLAHAATPEQRAAWEKRLEYVNRQNGTHVEKAKPTAEIKEGVYETHAGRGDGAVMKITKQTTYAEPQLRPGHIMLNGMETTVEAARAAGYDVGGEGEQRRPFGGNGRTSPQLAGIPRDTFPTIQTGAQRGVVQQPAQKPQNGPQESTGGQEQGPEGVTPGEVAKAASEAIQAIERTYGPQIVDAALEDAVDSGYWPEADQLPQGVSLAVVEKIVAGYTAQANDALSGVGASVDMLVETLGDDDLRHARSATIMGDRAKLEHLGRQAVNRLAMLPEADPEGFAEMVEGMSPAEREALSQNARGDWVVTVPGRKPMGFAAAVMAGIVRV